ncbi:hypothetical protein [Streptomyces rochei]|uniref:hypothetical protein n=1 Tax=Streptomyces rochei TaxID=1928 RepID=UPI0036989EA0
MSGFFDDVNVDDIPDNPNQLPNNTYHFRITGATLAPTKNRNNQPNYVPKMGITFKYQIIAGSWKTFFPISDWVRVPDKTMSKEEKEKSLSYLKMRLLAWGFSPEKIQKFGTDDFPVEDCINQEFYGTTSTKEENGRVNTRVTKFAPIGDDDGSDGYDDDPDY